MPKRALVLCTAAVVSVYAWGLVARPSEEASEESALLQLSARRGSSRLTSERALAVLREVRAPDRFVQLPGADVRLSFPMPDEGRPEACIDKVYDTSKMPRVSVIIPYLQENLTLLERTLGSLLYNTPPALLDAIVVVDDGNPPDFSFNETLKRLHPKVVYHRNEERQGLIKAKQTGADLSTSPVIVFLEPHCIANRGWLEPLLEQLQGNPRTIVIPVIDVLPEESPGTYQYVDSGWGGFDWQMDFDWQGTAPQRNSSYQEPDPYPMPCMSGGLLALWRDWWIESGKYDDKMTEWGGEHVEMSMRSWRCGGSVMGVPCSRVAHMFRKSRPYTFHGEAYTVNKQRLVKVWLEDEYAEHVYKLLPYLKENTEAMGDVSARLALKERLHCKSMDWYVKNVFPELLDKDQKVAL